MNTKSLTSFPSLAAEAVNAAQELIENTEDACLVGSAVEGDSLISGTTFSKNDY